MPHFFFNFKIEYSHIISFYIGWNWWGEAGGIRIYFHRGESVAIRTREVHEAGELYRALTFSATSAAAAEQLQLRRNNAGQLGVLLNYTLFVEFSNISLLTFLYF